MKPADRRGLNVALLATIALALGHLGWVALHPRGADADWLVQTFSLGVLFTSALTCWCAARSTPETAPPWRWMTLALGLYAVSDTLYALLEWRGGSVPSPSVLDALYLGFYVLFIRACLALPRQPLRRAEAWRLALDVGIVVGSLGVLLWYGALASLLGAAQVTVTGTLVNLAYPVLGLCALGLLMALIRRHDHIELKESLLALGLTTFLIGDTLYLFINANGGFTSGIPEELLWTCGALLFAVAAWISGRAAPLGPSLTAVAQVTAQITRPLYALTPYLGLAACFALTLTTHGEVTLAAHGALWGTAGVTLLVAARQIAALRDNAALTAQLAALNASLEQRVVARTAEVELGRAQLEARARELAWQAQHDSLTGLPNRAGFLSALGEAVEQQTQTGQTAPALAVLFLDLDGFKEVNDTLGHTVGDQLLIRVAARLRGALLPGEFTARLGGDEFMVLTSGSPHARAQQVLDLFAPPFDLGGRPVRISASVGVSVYPDSGRDAESLYMHADVAMYEAKRSGKSAARVFVPQTTQALRSRIELEDRLRGALKRGEFRLYYQPIYDVARQVVALEALLRWDSPELGLLSPGQFLPVIHGGGLDGELGNGDLGDGDLGDWVLNEACAQLARWHAAGHRGLRMAVNIFPSQFRSATFAETVEAALTRHGLTGAALELEVTGTLLSGCEAHAADMMHALQAQGIQWSLSGFGVQTSALSPLLKLPLGVLKLDRSLIGALDGPLDGQPQARRTVGAITTLAGALGLSVVAEGIETRAQWAAVTNLGCIYSQGFWLGRPQNVAKTADRLGRAPGHPPNSIPVTPS